MTKDLCGRGKNPFICRRGAAAQAKDSAREYDIYVVTRSQRGGFALFSVYDRAPERQKECASGGICLLEG